MFEKLAAIADFADQNGQYGVANDATKIIKEAQLWDAIKTLFDPEHTPGVDADTSWRDRLSRGWGRGKMDRNLGLVLSIMTERTKLNEKIEKMTAPIKGFQTEVTSFYDRLRDGRITSSNLRQESRVLQSALKDALSLISGKELKQTLKLRERLEKQQQIAADKMKGLDDTTRSNLMAVLKGESLPGIGSVPGSRAPIGDGGTDAMKRWLKNQPIPKLSMHDGAITQPGQYSFRGFKVLYGYNPKAIVDYFGSNIKAQEEAFDRYPKVFHEMFRHAQALQTFDDEVARGVHPDSVRKYKKYKMLGISTPSTPAAAAAKKVVEQAKASGDSEFSMPDVNEPNENKEPAKSGPNKDVVMPNVSEPSVAKKLEQLDMKDITSIPLDIKERTERDKEVATESHKALKKERKKNKKQEEPRGAQAAPTTLPEEATKREVEEEGVASADDTLSLAASASQRMGRQITRLGRAQRLRKLAGSFSFDADPSVMVEDELNKLINEMPEDKYLEFAQEDEDAKEPIYVDMFDANPDGRETFDEGMDYDPAQTGVEMYHGPDIDDEHWADDNMFGMDDKDDPGPDLYDAFPEGRETFDEEMDYDPAETALEMGNNDSEYQLDMELAAWRKSQSVDLKLNQLYTKIEQINRFQKVTGEETPGEQMELDKLHQEIRKLDKLKILEKRTQALKGLGIS